MNSNPKNNGALKVIVIILSLVILLQATYVIYSITAGKSEEFPMLSVVSIAPLSVALVLILQRAGFKNK